MNQLRKLIHLIALAGWTVEGLVFTLRAPFAAADGWLAAGGWWLWFGAFAGLTSLAVWALSSPAKVALLHAGVLATLIALPHAGALGWVRWGLDRLLVAA